MPAKKPAVKTTAKAKPAKPKAAKPKAKAAAAPKAAAPAPVKKLRIQDLERIRDKARALATIRDSEGRAKVTVHMGTCGIAAGARDIMDALLDEMKTKNVKDVIVTTSGCAGFCNREPMATVELKDKPPVKYADLTPGKIRKILNDHVLGGQIVVEYALALGSETLY
jgi:NADP-reducing hydrogenase subunit HndB